MENFSSVILIYLWSWKWEGKVAPLVLKRNPTLELGFRLRPIRRGQFQSRDKDGGHTISFAIPENHMVHANLMALCFIEPELLPMEFLRCGNRYFPPFLLLWPVTFIYKLDSYFLEIAYTDVQIWTSYVKAFESYRLTDKQTDTTEIRYHAVVKQTVSDPLLCLAEIESDGLIKRHVSHQFQMRHVKY